jgi:protein-disulfide isomerase
MTHVLEKLTNVLVSAACIVIVTVGIMDWRVRNEIRNRPTSVTIGNRSDQGEAVETETGETTIVPAAATNALRDSDVVVVEFSDFECPYCGRYASDTFGEIRQKLVTTGAVAYVFRHFPLVPLHKRAAQAAAAAECARAAGRFWEMHDVLFAHQRALEATDVAGYAKDIGLNPDEFRSCLTTKPEAVFADMAEGRRLRVNSTPTFFIGRLDATDRTKVNIMRRIRGSRPYTVFAAAIDDLKRSVTAASAGFR